MINKLPYAHMGYSGGQKLFDNDALNWQPLTIGKNFKGTASFIELKDRIILTGILTATKDLSVGATPADLIMFALPSQYVITGLPNTGMLSANSDGTYNAYNGQITNGGSASVHDGLFTLNGNTVSVEGSQWGLDSNITSRGTHLDSFQFTYVKP